MPQRVLREGARPPPPIPRKDFCRLRARGPGGRCDRTWSVNVESPLASAMLREGERTLPLKVKGRQFELPLYDAGWGNDAVVDLAFVAPEGATP